MVRDIAILACHMHTGAEASLPYRRFEEGRVDLQIAIDATRSSELEARMVFCSNLGAPIRQMTVYCVD